MEKRFTNKIISVDDIIQIANEIDKYSNHYKNLEMEEEKKQINAKDNGEYYSKKLISVSISYSLGFSNHETITNTDALDWFTTTLTAKAKDITEARISFIANEEGKSENLYINFIQNSIYFSSNSRNLNGNEIGRTVENFLNSLPPRLNDVIKKDNRRKFIPSLCVSLFLSLIASTIFLF